MSNNQLNLSRPFKGKEGGVWSKWDVWGEECKGREGVEGRSVEGGGVCREGNGDNIP